VVRWADLTPYGPAGQSRFANDLTIDAQGNAYLTDSMGSQIWQVTPEGIASTFVNDSRFDLDPTVGFGLNGIEYHPKGYLLVGKMGTSVSAALFKVGIQDRIVNQVKLRGDISGADGIIFKPNNSNILYVVGDTYVYEVESTDDWSSATVTKTTVPSTCITPTTATFVGSQLFVNCGNQFGVGPYSIERVDFSSSSSSGSIDTALILYIVLPIVVVSAIIGSVWYRYRKPAPQDIDMDVDNRPGYERLEGSWKTKIRTTGAKPEDI